MEFENFLDFILELNFELITCKKKLHQICEEEKENKIQIFSNKCLFR
jgi:hypothetical protein